MTVINIDDYGKNNKYKNTFSVKKRNLPSPKIIYVFVVILLLMIGGVAISKSLYNNRKMEELLSEAEGLAIQYDYEGAVKLLDENKTYSDEKKIRRKIKEYKEIKTSLVRQDISQITHVFFHSLVVDENKAFYETNEGYNSVMTTISEFKEILEQMYERGYVLVSLHDMAEIQEDEDGTQRMVEKDIMLPEGKKAFIMSQDDVCYYEYMEGDGFAERMVFDEGGNVTCEYVNEEGKTVKGEYDLVPILDAFVKEHPDFSYKGAKAILAFTGYNGILGYRTDETYDADSEYFDEKETNNHIEEDRAYVKKLTQALKESGYEFASHSWGHLNYGSVAYEVFLNDIERWERNVEPLLPDSCDILLFPFGADIGDWHYYTMENKRFSVLKENGFNYYCNVDSAQFWVQMGETYLRQGRRNLDGYRLWMDYSGQADRLSDLMDVEEVFDTNRPTPVNWN